MDEPPHKRRRLMQDEHNSVSTCDGDEKTDKQQQPILTTADCQESFETVLSRINVNGLANVTSSGIATSLPNICGLNINGIGNISLPLSESDVSGFIDVCEKVSYGKELKTTTDEFQNVTKSYQLNADKFNFTNPKWNLGIQQLTQQIGIEMGYAGDNDREPNVVSQCHKLLIYEKNGHFIDDRDTEKLEGTFARLIIQLPCIFTVTNQQALLIVKHKNKEYKHYFGTNAHKEEDSCKHNIYYASYYCDLVNKVNEIESGYRVVVIYNLCWQGDIKMMPSARVEDSIRQLQEIIRQWNENKKDNGVIGISLEHSYTESELSKKGILALKGVDFERISILKQAANMLTEKERLAICICDFELQEEECDVGGNGDYDECTWLDDEAMLGTIFLDENGVPIKRIDSNLLQFDVDCNMINFGTDKNKWKLSNEIKKGYLSDEEPTRTVVYQRFGVLVWKRQFEFEMIVAARGIQFGIQIIYDMLDKLLSKQICPEVEDDEKTEPQEWTQTNNKEKSDNSENSNDNSNNASNNDSCSKDWNIVTNRIDAILRMFNYRRARSGIDGIMELLYKTKQYTKLCNFIEVQVCGNNHIISSKKGMGVLTGLLSRCGWEDTMIKKTFLKYLQIMLNGNVNVNRTKSFCRFVSTMSQTNKECECELTKELIDHMMHKLELNQNGTAMKALDADIIIEIAKFCIHAEFLQLQENKVMNSGSSNKNKSAPKQDDEDDDDITGASKFLEAFEIGYMSNLNLRTRIKVAGLLSTGKCQESILQSEFGQTFIESVVNELENRVSGGEPVMSWKISSAKSCDPEVQSFLRGSNKSCQYGGSFTSIEDARKFCTRHNSKYVQCTANEKSKESFVALEKTGVHFEQAKQGYNLAINAIKQFKKLMVDFSLYY